MSCEVEMRRGKERLMLKIRYDYRLYDSIYCIHLSGTEKVARWRDAIARSSQGLSAKGEVEGSARTGEAFPSSRLLVR